jgi:hypothetical protein
MLTGVLKNPETSPASSILQNNSPQSPSQTSSSLHSLRANEQTITTSSISHLQPAFPRSPSTHPIRPVSARTARGAAHPHPRTTAKLHHFICTAHAPNLSDVAHILPSAQTAQSVPSAFPFRAQICWLPHVTCQSTWPGCLAPPRRTSSTSVIPPLIAHRCRAARENRRTVGSENGP